jgi:GDP-4-dehydro-6-deoxy-D-mannose reductase
MRITVTGAGGFIGSYLVAALAARGDEVDAWSRPAVDVTDAAAVAAALARFAPDAVVHLAALSLPARSWEAPAATFAVNVGGTLNLLEAARALPQPPRILLAGTSAEYADAPGGEPIAEDAPLEPNSPYAVSKLAAGELGRIYGRRYGLAVLRFRPFFLVGPGKTGDVCSDFAQRIVAVERGVDATMRVGDLTAVRDMIDVRDGVAALLRLIDAGAAGEIYNVCRGSGVRVGDVLETFRGLAAVPVTVAADAGLMRPLEHSVKIGDPAKLRALGWAPRYALDDTLRAILAEARAR